MTIHRELINLFTTPVTAIQFGNTFDFSKYAKIILNRLTAQQLQDMDNIGIDTTDDNLNTLPEFQELVNLIDNEVKMYFDMELGLTTDDIHLSCMWANVQIDGCRHHAHVHPNSFFSGVLYLDIPNTDSIDPGNIFFIDPRPAKQMQSPDYRKHNALTDRSYGFRPETGLMLLFPSWLEHGTDVCKIGKDAYRVSLSFNYVLTKSSGKTMKLNLKP
jgi:uncharacterized protein (TIGR02466 family)